MNDLDVGFVLSVTAYREHDAMILFLGKEKGLLRFVLPGYYKENSKQGALGLEYSKVRYRFRYRKDALLRIQTGELLESYYESRTSFDWLVTTSLLAELCIRFYDEYHGEQWFNWFDIYLAHQSDAQFAIILTQMIRLLGYQPYVKGCVVTNNPRISDFSIERGGFVSLEYRNPLSKVNLEMLQILRYIFSTDDLDVDRLNRFDSINDLIEILVEYLQYHADIKLNSWKLISSV